MREQGGILVMPVGEADRSGMLKLRYEIEDRLTAEVLGKKGSGREIGILLGGTMGRDNLYIDLLLYDAPAFMEQASSRWGNIPIISIWPNFGRRVVW